MAFSKRGPSGLVLLVRSLASRAMEPVKKHLPQIHRGYLDMVDRKRHLIKCSAPRSSGPKTLLLGVYIGQRVADWQSTWDIDNESVEEREKQ